MKILIVDDHSYNRDLLSFILEDHEYESVQACDGEQACQMVEEDLDIGLVLMDVIMPKMDGLEATKKIKQQSQNRFLPVLFVTSLDDEKNVTACLESGGDDFVPKPINENILLAKVNAHTRSKALYDKLKSANEELEYHRLQVEREHSIVERIFLNGSERVKTECDNMTVHTSPMSMFNGDVVLVAPSPSGGVYCLVGDFTGHGLAASIGSLPVTEVFFQSVSRRASISQIARDINHRLKVLLPSNMFFCAALAELDFTGETLTIWLGGMNDMLMVCDRENSIERIESDHMPMGILNDEEFDDSPRVIALKEGSRCYVYTDGITEAQNDRQEEYGQARLEACVLNASENTITKVIDEVHDFTHLGEQTDDLSILEIRQGKVVHRAKTDGEVFDVGKDYHKADSIPWHLQMELTGDDLKSTSVVDQVMSFVSSIQGIELHQDKIFTIVSELYNNSLEHGLLGLDSNIKKSADGFETYYKLRQERLDNLADQYIKIDFIYIKGDPNYIKLAIEDSGEGFDVDTVLENKRSEGESHGRGLHLLDHLCASLEYTEGGRRVEAVYELRQH